MLRILVLDLLILFFLALGLGVGRDDNGHYDVHKEVRANEDQGVEVNDCDRRRPAVHHLNI